MTNLVNHESVVPLVVTFAQNAFDNLPKAKGWQKHKLTGPVITVGMAQKKKPNILVNDNSLKVYREEKRLERMYE